MQQEKMRNKWDVHTFPWGIWVLICGTIAVIAGCICGYLAQTYIQNPFLGLFSLGFFFGFVLVGMILMFIFAAKMGEERRKREQGPEKSK
jgi:uncharacterized membrane protein